MTGDEFRAMALGLAGTSEAPHFDRTAFKAGKAGKKPKTFATLAGDGSNGMVHVKPLEQALALLAAMPDQFFSFGKWTTNHGYLGVNLPAADPELVRGLLTAAWEGVRA